MHQKIMF